MSSMCKGFRFPSEIIVHCVWLYHRFTLSFREIELLMAERGIEVTYETIRTWCARFGPEYARRTARPVDSVTLALFIAENPAAFSTQRRRNAIVNAVHRAAGLPAPGGADTIRRIVNTSRADRLSSLEAVVSEIIPRLLVFGCPDGLFGRRDALLLLLASSGLSIEQISALHRTSIHIDVEAIAAEDSGILHSLRR